MFILDPKGIYLFNTDLVERFAIVDKSDAVLIVASYSGSPVTVARYGSTKEAREAMSEITRSLMDGKPYHSMPLSALLNEEQKIYDKRVKRRGGS